MGKTHGVDELAVGFNTSITGKKNEQDRHFEIEREWRYRASWLNWPSLYFFFMAELEVLMTFLLPPGCLKVIMWLAVKHRFFRKKWDDDPHQNGWFMVGTIPSTNGWWNLGYPHGLAKKRQDLWKQQPVWIAHVQRLGGQAERLCRASREAGGFSDPAEVGRFLQLGRSDDAP